MYQKIIKWTVLVWMILSAILLVIGYGFNWQSIEIKKPNDYNVTVEKMQQHIKSDVDKFVHNYNDIFKTELEKADSAKVEAMNVVLNNKVTAEVNKLVDKILKEELEDAAAKACILDTTALVKLQHETFAQTIGSDVATLVAAEKAAIEKAEAEKDAPKAKKGKKNTEPELAVKFSEKVTNNTLIVKELNNNVHKNLESARWKKPFVIDLVSILFYWTYIMFGVALISMIIVSLVIGTLNNPKSLIKLCVVILGIAVIVAIAYFTASGAPAMGIAAGKQPDATVLKFTDTILNLTLITAGAAILSIAFGWVYNMIKK